MSTALVTTTYLLPEERYQKTVKFIQWYQKVAPHWDVVVLDNASPTELVDKLQATFPEVQVVRFQEFYDRPEDNHYLYLWRAIYYLKAILYQGYDKVIYADNDFYILSRRLLDRIDSIREGWSSFWCEKYDFNETGCQVIVRGDPTYHSYVASGEFGEHNNKKEMEHLLPITNVIRDMVGDRWGEEGATPKEHMDYFAQAQLGTKLPTSLY